MSKFGWSYPPGVTGREPELSDCGPCECCGHEVDDCICPPCPVCGETGNPKCYAEEHESETGLTHPRMEYSLQQLLGQQRLRILDLEDQLSDAKFALAELEGGSDDDDV